MAVYEPEHDRIVVRIVYDGPGRAGKTSNVAQLARVLGSITGNELFLHSLIGERTELFDWFSFDAGTLGKHQLRVQVVGVPGHKSFEARRSHILCTADVVVLVCDSASSSLDSCRETFDSLCEYLNKQTTNVPLIVQANKQDLPQALRPHELGTMLGLPYVIPVFGANSQAGHGVRETAAQALHVAVRQVKYHIAKNGLASIVGRAETCDELREAVLGLGERGSAEDGPAVKIVSVTSPPNTPLAGPAGGARGNDGSAGRPASEAQPAAAGKPQLTIELTPTPGPAAKGSAAAEGAGEPVSPAVAADELAREPAPAADVPVRRRRAVSSTTRGASSEPGRAPVSLVSSDGGARVKTESAEAEGRGASVASVVRAPPAPPSAAPPAGAARGLPPPTVARREESARRPAAVPRSSRVEVERAAAPANGEPGEFEAVVGGEPAPAGPRADVPSGCVWPVPGGRAVLEKLGGLTLERVKWRQGHVPEVSMFVAAGFCLRTRADWRHADADAGREALLRYVRRCARLGALQPAGLTVALDGGEGGSMWHIVPVLSTMEVGLRRSPALAARLAAAHAAALQLAAREGVVLSLEPRDFAVQGELVVYVGARVDGREQVDGVAAAWAAAVARLGGAAAEAYAAALEQELPAALTAEEQAKLGLAREVSSWTSPGRERIRAVLAATG